MVKKITLNLLYRSALLCAFLLGACYEMYAQLPSCPATGGIIYYHSVNSIYNLDPTQPLSATNPTLNTITMPSGNNGFAVSANLNDPNGPSPTFYTSVNGFYYYYNGPTAGWVNTGHASSAANMGAGGGYIYNLVGPTGQVYRYNGTANDVLIATVSDFGGGGPYDVVGDCAGNWYLLRTETPQWMREYSSTGTLLNTWTLTGAPSMAAGGGFGVIGNMVYYNNLSGYYSGVISGSNITFTAISAAGLNPGPYDFASCPLGGAPVVTINDTLFNCIPGASKTITASGIAPFSYTVVNGSATVTGTGPSFGVTNTQPATVILHSISNSLCSSGPVSDTFLLIPPPLVNAGSDDTLFGCASYIDTLKGTLGNSTSWVNYTYTWSPSGIITSGGSTAQPVVTPTQDTTFVLTITTDPSQGGCTLRDSVRIKVKDESVMPDYSFTIKRGCDADTVLFNNISFQSTSSLWDFADGTTDTIMNPTHIYGDQGIYNVKLVASNYMCRDSAIRIVDTRHPLVASFTAGNDTICLGTAIAFSNGSTVSLQPAAYSWHFGDTGTSVQMNPTHTYAAPGTYQVMLITSDAIPCYDTAYHTIVVDSTPSLEVTLSSHNICTGEAVTAVANYLQSGSTGLDWNFGDNYLISGPSAPSHAYVNPGTYYINVTGHYRACSDTTRTDSVNVHAIPLVTLGNDTVMCLQSDPLFLSNLQPSQTGDHYLWSTGDTTAVLKVVHHGIYSLRVTNQHDCSATDDIIIAKDCYTDIPNSFTPNGDGTNDYFFPRQWLSKSVTGFKMQVFNRWGQTVFETTNPSGRGWDGMFNNKPQPAGVYIYSITTLLKNGRTEQATGNVTLLR